MAKKEKNTPVEIKVEIEDLAREIKRHDQLYYQDNQPEISDAEYDKLLRRLQKLEEQYPEYISPASPTQKPGGAPAEGFNKVEHISPMLSLANAANESEAEAFLDRVRRFLKLSDEEKIEILAEPKIDGLSVALLYHKGELRRAATRGDGRQGEDITNNIRTFAEIPKRLKGSHPPDEIEIRGEAYMAHDDFVALNEKQQSAGKQIFANSAQCGGRVIAAIGCSDYRFASSAFFCFWLGGAGQASR